MILISLWLACSGDPESAGDPTVMPDPATDPATTGSTAPPIPLTITRLTKASPPSAVRMDLSGVEARCEADGSVVLGMEYTGEASGLLATAWLDGAEVLAVELPVPADQSSLFKLVQLPTALDEDCAALSWVFEATNADRRSCRVVGPEAEDLVEPPTVDEAEEGIDEERCVQP